MDPYARRKARQRVDRITDFREELAEIEQDEALRLTPEQRSGLETYHERVLAELKNEFDIELAESGRRISWGMRLASFLGGAAFFAALVLFLHRIWGNLPVAAQVTILTVLPLLAVAGAELLFRRQKGLYHTALLVWAAGVGFVMELTALGSVLNVVSSGLALLTWGAFAMLLAHAYGLRLLLGAGLLILSGYVSSLLLVAQGAFREEYMGRPEAFVVIGLMIYAVPWVGYRQDRNDFGFVYRFCGVFLALLALLFLSEDGRMSYLPFESRTVEALYQVLGLVLSAAVVCHGIGLSRSGLVNAGALGFVIFLYVKLHAWWWDWMPKSLFFLLIGLISVVLAYLFRLLRTSLMIKAKA